MTLAVQWAGGLFTRDVSDLTTPEKTQAQYAFYKNTSGLVSDLLRELHIQSTTDWDAIVEQSERPLSLDDFLEILSKEKSAFVQADKCTTDDLKDAFTAVGGNSDTTGEVDVNFMKTLCNQFGLTIDIDQLMSEIDENGDDSLDYQEFATMLTEDTIQEDLELLEHELDCMQELGKAITLDYILHFIADHNLVVHPSHAERLVEDYEPLSFDPLGASYIGFSLSNSTQPGRQDEPLQALRIRELRNQQGRDARSSISSSGGGTPTVQGISGAASMTGLTTVTLPSSPHTPTADRRSPTARRGTHMYQQPGFSHVATKKLNKIDRRSTVNLRDLHKHTKLKLSLLPSVRRDRQRRKDERGGVPTSQSAASQVSAVTIMEDERALKSARTTQSLKHCVYIMSALIVILKQRIQQMKQLGLTGLVKYESVKSREDILHKLTVCHRKLKFLCHTARTTKAQQAEQLVLFHAKFKNTKQPWWLQLQKKTKTKQVESSPIAEKPPHTPMSYPSEGGDISKSFSDDTYSSSQPSPPLNATLAPGSSSPLFSLRTDQSPLARFAAEQVNTDANFRLTLSGAERSAAMPFVPYQRKTPSQHSSTKGKSMTEAARESIPKFHISSTSPKMHYKPTKPRTPKEAPCCSRRICPYRPTRSAIQPNHNRSICGSSEIVPPVIVNNDAHSLQHPFWENYSADNKLKSYRLLRKESVDQPQLADIESVWESQLAWLNKEYIVHKTNPPPPLTSVDQHVAVAKKRVTSASSSRPTTATTNRIGSAGTTRSSYYGLTPTPTTTSSRGRDLDDTSCEITPFDLPDELKQDECAQQVATQRIVSVGIEVAPSEPQEKQVVHDYAVTSFVDSYMKLQQNRRQSNPLPVPIVVAPTPTIQPNLPKALKPKTEPTNEGSDSETYLSPTEAEDSSSTSFEQPPPAYSARDPSYGMVVASAYEAATRRQSDDRGLKQGYTSEGISSISKHSTGSGEQLDSTLEAFFSADLGDTQRSLSESRQFKLRALDQALLDSLSHSPPRQDQEHKRSDNKGINSPIRRSSTPTQVSRRGSTPPGDRSPTGKPSLPPRRSSTPTRRVSSGSTPTRRGSTTTTDQGRIVVVGGRRRSCTPPAGGGTPTQQSTQDDKGRGSGGTTPPPTQHRRGAPPLAPNHTARRHSTTPPPTQRTSAPTPPNGRRNSTTPPMNSGARRSSTPTPPRERRHSTTPPPTNQSGTPPHNIRSGTPPNQGTLQRSSAPSHDNTRRSSSPAPSGSYYSLHDKPPTGLDQPRRSLQSSTPPHDKTRRSSSPVPTQDQTGKSGRSNTPPRRSSSPAPDKSRSGHDQPHRTTPPPGHRRSDEPQRNSSAKAAVPDKPLSDKPQTAGRSSSGPTPPQDKARRGSFDTANYYALPDKPDQTRRSSSDNRRSPTPPHGKTRPAPDKPQCRSSQSITPPQDRPRRSSSPAPDKPGNGPPPRRQSPVQEASRNIPENHPHRSSTPTMRKGRPSSGKRSTHRYDWPSTDSEEQHSPKYEVPPVSVLRKEMLDSLELALEKVGESPPKDTNIHQILKDFKRPASTSSGSSTVVINKFTGQENFGWNVQPPQRDSSSSSFDDVYPVSVQDLRREVDSHNKPKWVSEITVDTNTPKHSETGGLYTPTIIATTSTKFEVLSEDPRRPPSTSKKRFSPDKVDPEFIKRFVDEYDADESGADRYH